MKKITHNYRCTLVLYIIFETCIILDRRSSFVHCVLIDIDIDLDIHDVLYFSNIGVKEKFSL